jgi:tripartite ATP-independent transporter DctP family solute receptor
VTTSQSRAKPRAGYPATRVLTLCTLATLFIGATPSAPAADIQMKIAHVVPGASPRGRGATRTAELISTDSRCEIDARVYPSGQLGGDTDLIEGLQIGSIEMVILPGSFLVGFQPLMGVLDFPFFFPPDWTDLKQVHDSDAMRSLLATTEEKGIVSLGVWHTGFKVWTSNERPLNTAENYSGLKARVMPSTILKEQARGIGLTAVGMPFSETYSALQIGAIDAQENPITTTFFMKFYEVQEHLALTNHGTLDQVVMVSGRWWEARSAPCQTAIRQAVTVGGDLTAELTFTVIDSQALPAFAANGMAIHNLNDEDREIMRARVLPGIERVYLEQTGVRGRAILDAFNNEIAKYVE